MAEYKIKRLGRGWVGKKTKLTVTSPFGMRKLSKSKAAKMHCGIDIGIPQGTPIYSPVSGTATVVKSRGGGGLLISIINKGYKYFFMHLHKTAIHNGAIVREGQLIAYSGGKPGDPNAGTSTGAHLHFEVRKAPYGGGGKDAINPIYFLSDELTGAVKQNRMNQEIITISIVGEIKDPTKKNHYTIVTTEQINEDKKRDVSDEVDNSATEEETVIVETEYQEGLAAGIWQIVKLVMDTDVANIRLRDAATSIQQGSLQTFFNKICQKPFVEFSGDTFGDQYYFLVRKPPFDKEGMQKTMIAQGLFENYDNDIKIRQEKNSPYEIDENDIISSNIAFNTQGIYSWYQFYPIYEMGATEELQYLIPAILFPEYADIWGSRSLQIRSQYRNFINPALYDDVKNGEKNEVGDAEVRHSMKDLHYIIESNAYAPFVRSGTIQLLGNRRIKRGTFIRINWHSLRCGEIFYVESVSHSYSVSTNSVNRTTTLSLSHGMIEDFIFNHEITVNKIINEKDKIGKREKELNVSYFNIINFGDFEKVKDRLDMDKWAQTISSWKVNIDVFLYFLRKLQFLGSALTATGIAGNENNTFRKNGNRS